MGKCAAHLGISPSGQSPAGRYFLQVRPAGEVSHETGQQSRLSQLQRAGDPDGKLYLRALRRQQGIVAFPLMGKLRFPAQLH